jgi:hypothetical protein
MGKLPLAVGVPEIRPVLAARLRPAGRLPELIDQERGDVPPAAMSVLEYAVPPVPAGKALVLIESPVACIWIVPPTETV